MPEAIGVVVGLAALILLWKPFFGNLQGFLECVKYYLTPDAVSMFRGEFHRDWASSMKLGLWLLCGIGTGLGAWGAVNAIVG